MDNLYNMHCVPCESNEPPMTEEQANEELKEIPEWSLTPDKKSIQRHFEFKGFNKTMSFVNAIAWIVNQEGHHPTIKIGYDYCHVFFSTHAINGLSKNDFICAAKIDALLK